MISFLAEFPDIRNNGRPIVETPISIEAARAFNTVGAATLTIPDFIDRRSFRKNTRMRLWRRGLDGTATLFGDTNWFLRKISHNYTSQTYAIEFEDAISLLQHRRVAYTSQTPYADKTLEEFGLIVPNDSLRIDNMMRQYVRENYSTLALDTARNNLLITVEDDRNLGPYGEKEASWQVLGDVLNNLADMSAEKGLELFYDLVPQPDDSMVFKVWDKVRRVDRGSDSFNILTLSQELNHLTDVEEVEDYTELGTYVYVLGYDSGPSQIIVEVSDEVEIDSDPFGRIEFTEAAPDVDRESVLEDYGQAALRGKRGIRRVSARAVEGTGIVYGRDYSYGDRVMIQVGTRKYNCHVKAVSTRWEAGVEDLDVRLEGYAGHEVDAFPTFLLPSIDNEAPVVNAGANQEVDEEETANLEGTASDDGLPDPPAALTYEWEEVSGPGTVTFGTPDALETTADFDAFGTYVLRLSASDSALISSDEMTVVVEGTTVPPSMGLIEGVEEVAGIGSDGFIYRTSDFQTPSGSGGPTWDRVDTTIPGTRHSFVVDPFSPGYLTGVGAINGWIVNDTDIYRVTDFFGSVVAVSVFTFPVPTVAASYHWRTIQASFGAFFDEGTNPWLLCVSHYRDTAGHTGTWATRSLDGGVTWSAEVLVSADFDSDVPTRFNPIGVYTSPKTPGYALTAAPGELVDNPSEPLPRWALFHIDPVASGLEVLNLGGSFTAIARAEEVGAMAGIANHEFWIMLAPPKDAARVLVEVSYVAHREQDGSSSSTALSFGNIANGSNMSHTDDLLLVQPPTPDGISTDSFTIEWTKSDLADWDINTESIISSPPVIADGARIRVDTLANASGGASPYALIEITMQFVVMEIELENGHIYTPATGQGGGFDSTDWGETWSATSTAPVDDPANPLPLWGWWEGNTLTELGLSASQSLEISASATDPGPIVSVTKSLMVAPPEDAVRVEVDVVWSAVHTRTGGAASGTSSMNLLEPINVTQAGTDDYDSPEPNTATSGSFSITYTLASGADWPISRESIEAGHPASASGTRCQVTTVADASGAGNVDETIVNITMTVTEIELDGGYIYQPAPYGSGVIQPGDGQAGSIHVPWIDNADEELIYFGYFDKMANHLFRLLKSEGGIISDISPTDTGVDYGVHHYGFAIRAYDSDRQFLALGGIGNETSADPADDLVGLWVSSNAGAAWANILAPVAAAEALYGLQIAFAGDSSDVLFSWGGWSNAATLAAIYYSDDFGATLDSREGNINSLGTVAFLGIAGGPVAP